LGENKDILGRGVGGEGGCQFCDGIKPCILQMWLTPAAVHILAKGLPATITTRN